MNSVSLGALEVWSRGTYNCAGKPTWNPRVCRTMVFLAIYSGFGPLFYILWGSRYSQRRQPTSGHLLEARSNALLTVFAKSLAPLSKVGPQLGFSV